ncbi:MAG: Gfo/Idh/MocA family oxidoreductase [Chloroflexota bacterium]
MMTKSLGVLLVSGALTHQENYSLKFRDDPRCRLIGVTDEANVDAERTQLNQAWAEKLDIPYLPNLGDALHRADVDIVSICAEPERRGRIAVECANAEKHIYLDKPVTPFLTVADSVVEAVQQNGVRSQMFSFIYQPWVQRAKQIVASGELGDLLAVHADCLFAKGPNGTAQLGTIRQSPYPPKISNFVDAKAELYAMGIYSLGVACWLIGHSVQTVYGQTANYFFEAHQHHNVEDFGYLMLTFSNGATATITGGRIGWTGHASGGNNQVYLIGTKKSLLIDAYRPRLEVYDRAPAWASPEVNPRDPMGFWSSTQAEVNIQPKRIYTPFMADFRGDEQHFVDCIVEDRESEMNAQQAATLTEILLAGYQSASQGHVVSLPLSR